MTGACSHERWSLVTAGGVESRGKRSPQNQCFIRGDNIFEIIYIYIYNQNICNRYFDTANISRNNPS